MIRRSVFVLLILVFVFPLCVFSQQIPASGGLRDYVGLINQTYHPDIVAFFGKIKADLAKRGGNETAIKAIDIFLRGDTGSGFLYNDARGNLYVITNNHVVAQAYSLSITFERQDGSKRKHENIRIIAADEENDIAILGFSAADRPAGRGLTLLTRAVDEGVDVYSAGFPGLGTTPLWQFGRGMVSNANARFPKSFDDDTLIGPFIQHTAEIDPGNSGGPLLVVDRNAAAGYTVAGINTLKAVRRQAANYAIPVSTIQPFITGALNPRPETYRAALDTRLAGFAEGLSVNKAVYPHIARYLSSNCIGENAEYAMSEMYDKGSSLIRRAFIDKCEDSVVEAMGYAVAWTIENSIRGQGVIRASIKEVTGAGEEYTAVFTINNKDFSSKWVWEYGNWRIRSFGTVAAGDKELLAKKEKAKKTAEDLRIDRYNVHLEAGYAYLFDRASAAGYVSFDYAGFGAKAYFAGSDFFSIGAFAGIRGGFALGGSVGIMPYARIGIDYQHDQKYKDFFKDASDSELGFPITTMVQAGVKVTTAKVPGLFAGMAFQYNIFNMHDTRVYDKDNLMKMGLCFTAGYAF
ncbi:MAG: serine protease [Treponema sp.]|nr:serine protease [Treponema sp.]